MILPRADSNISQHAGNTLGLQILVLSVFACIVNLIAAAANGNAHDVVVVSAEEFRPTLQPWIQQRQGEGLSITFCLPAPTSAATLQHVRAAAKPGETKYLLLVGDCPDFGARSKPREIPTHYLAAKVTSRFGSTPTYPSDLPYGDFDGDGQTDASVGRMPVNSIAELAALLNRILSYEQSTDFGPWRNRLQLTGGVGGFGGMIDTAIESVTRTVLTSVLPPQTQTQVAYACPGHAFCPTDVSFVSTVKDRYRQGARFWVYAGHGSVDRLDLLTRSTSDSGSLQSNDTTRSSDRKWTTESLVSNVTADQWNGDPKRGSIGVLLACYAGAFDAPGDCLGERMLLSPGGPVTMLAASRLTMPYGNARFGLGMLQSVYDPSYRDQDSVQRLGDAMRSATQRVQQTASPNPNEDHRTATELMIDGVAALISPAGVDLNQERREHAGLYQLLGDPTLRLHPPLPISLTLDSDSKDSMNRELLLNIESPIDGELSITVDRPLGSQPGANPTEDNLDDPHGCRLVQMSESIRTGEAVKKSIVLAEHIKGPLIIRAFVAGTRSWATGAVRTFAQ